MPQANETPEKAGRVALILAGGGGRRMGGVDKGALLLGGRCLVDHLLARLAPQTDHILISGRHDYGTGLPVIGDRDDGPLGPAAGLWAALHWIEENSLETDGFMSAPVDGPFIPDNLFARLSGGVGSAIACDASGVQPAFAYWNCDALHAALSTAPENYGFPLKALADSVHAERVMFDEADAFLNVNSPEDLARAEDIVRG